MEIEQHSKPDHASLRRIRSLALFSDDQLTKLADKLTLKKANPGERLLSLGSLRKYDLYLLSGELLCKPADGISKSIVADNNGSLNPIAQVRPSLYDIDSASKVTYLEIQEELLSEFSQMIDQHSDNYEVNIIEQSEEANRLTIQLCTDMMSDSITLPSIPDVALKIQKAFNSEDFNIDIISQIIQSDPSISAKLLMISNSPLYRGDSKINSVQQAVVRLGMDTTRRQIMIYAAYELFREKSAGMKKKMQALWNRSRKVASLSRILATKSGLFDPELAQMAGLLSDLGIVTILQYAQEHSDLCDDEKQLNQTIRDLGPQINSMLLYHWKFDDDVVTVGEESRDWFRNHADNADLCDLVLIARFHSYIGTKSMYQLPALSKVPAFLKLNLCGIGVADSVNFLRESQTEIAAIEKMLGSI